MSASRPPNDRSQKDSLSVELGNWFRAYATGRGVIAIPLLVGLVLAAGLAKGLLG
jgi:hypothetical protein